MKLATGYLPQGITFGKYELVRRLATGGMAEIYLARLRGIEGFEKLVVIKRILSQFADNAEFVQMFLDEARLAATLQHPNIAQVYDVGTFEGSYFFAMEFIHGEDARSIKRAARRAGRPLPLAHALSMVHGTASALRYAHGKARGDGTPLGIVHRDVSLSNILVSYDGTVKLVDFGIAKATLVETKTRTGTLKGKIPYMSPEQCRGQPIDRRSDLFSLGVVLYELTTGKRPFRGPNELAVLDAIVHQEAQPPSALVPDYPPDLEHIVLQLLRRSASERYHDAEEVLLDLEAFVRDQRLAVSSIELGRYMGELFAGKMEAWRQAEEEGERFEDFVVKTITSESEQSVASLTPSISVETAGPPPQAAARARGFRRVRVLASAAVALVLGVAVVILAPGGGEPVEDSTPAPAAPPGSEAEEKIEAVERSEAEPAPGPEPGSEVSPEPEVSLEPEVSPEPGSEVSPEPEASLEPEVSPEPEVSLEPEPTAEPGPARAPERRQRPRAEPAPDRPRRDRAPDRTEPEATDKEEAEPWDRDSPLLPD